MSVLSLPDDTQFAVIVSRRTQVETTGSSNETVKMEPQFMSTNTLEE